MRLNWHAITARVERLPPGALGVACGVGAAFLWAGGLVSARHGIAIGFTPMDITFHRLVWPGLVFLPLVFAGGVADPRSVGWGRSIVLTILGGPTISLFSYAGFMLVPLGHGGVIQPSTAALSGLLLATLVLKERLLATRAAGAVAIVGGLSIIGFEALSTIGTHGLLGDLSFMAAGFTFACFGMMLKMWRMAPMRAVAVISVLSLVLVPVQFAFFGFDNMIARGLWENVAMALIQGLFAGTGATYLFARAVVLLGAARAAVFPALVPPFTLLVGYVAVDNVPTMLQILGLAVVLVGFRLTQSTK
jgi:drug/metabolite transporter (DMT)-like permease